MLAYARGRYIIKRCIDNFYAFVFLCRYGGGILDDVSGTAIDEDFEFLFYILAFVPLVKALPVVCPDDEAELMLRICFAEFAERGVHIRWDGEMIFEVGSS